MKMSRIIVGLVVLSLVAFIAYAPALAGDDDWDDDENEEEYPWEEDDDEDDDDCDEYDHVFKAKLRGSHEVPPVHTDAKGNFVAHLRFHENRIHYVLVATRIKNVVGAHIHVGARDENGPPVAWLFGPAEPGGGMHNGLLAKGHITEDDLIGPLEGMTLSDLITRMAEGGTYVNVHTDDGMGEHNTGPGDMASGEIRGQIELKGKLPPPPDMNARLQVIHNAADPAAFEVDIYVNDMLALDDFAFRSATPFMDVPAEEELMIGVAPCNSTSPDDIIASFPVTFTAGESYVAVAGGVLEPDSFAANPDGGEIGFTIFLKEDARECPREDEAIEFFALHGVTDAPTVDIIARDCETLVDDASYGDITDYIEIDPANYILDVTPGDDNETIVASFRADLEGVKPRTAVLFASGFLDSAENQDGPAFGLFAALTNGKVVELPMVENTARLQVVHNAADPGAASVDVYVNNLLTLDDFSFRSATPFIDVPAGEELMIGVAPDTSTSPDDIIASFPVTFMAGKSYVAVAGGVLEPDSFAANPDGEEIGFTIFLKEDAREYSMRPGMADLFFLHGVTDAPAVDIYLLSSGLVVQDASYGAMTDYISSRPGVRTAVLMSGYDGPSDSDYTYLGTYQIDLTGLSGSSAMVFASGFFDPAESQDGPVFGIFAALPGGSVMEFSKMTFSEQEAIAMIEDETGGGKDVPEEKTPLLGQNSPNPFNPSTTISFTMPTDGMVSIKVYDASGKEVRTLVEGRRSAGEHKVTFNAREIASGLYFYRMKTKGFVETRKMLVIR